MQESKGYFHSYPDSCECLGRQGKNLTKRRERLRIDEKTKDKLKQILLSIACADANEPLSWGRDAVMGQGDKIKLSKSLSRAVSSIKMKATRDGIDLDLKLLDKLKAIELYFKLCEDSGTGGGDGALNISYSYTSPEGHDD